MLQLPTNISITMKRQKKLIQTKITEANPEKEIDLTSLPEKELKIKLITILMELQRNMQELKDEVWREIIDIWRDITEMKQPLEGCINRMDKMQEAIDGIETRCRQCVAVFGSLFQD